MKQITSERKLFLNDKIRQYRALIEKNQTDYMQTVYYETMIWRHSCELFEAGFTN